MTTHCFPWLRRVGIALAVMAGCSTPSVPLPPPVVDVSALTFSSPIAGQIVLKGAASTAQESVRFFVFDTETGDGVIATTAADGSFTAPPLAAAVGNIAEVYFQRADGEMSNVTCLTVQLDSALVGDDCP